jgi:hypothetical protein
MANLGTDEKCVSDRTLVNRYELSWTPFDCMFLELEKAWPGGRVMAGWASELGILACQRVLRVWEPCSMTCLVGSCEPPVASKGSKIFAVGTLSVDRAQSPVLIMAVKPTGERA